MGLLNRQLGINLTDKDPLINSPFSSSASEAYINPPPTTDYMISETGAFMQTETSLNLMVTE